MNRPVWTVLLAWCLFTLGSSVVAQERAALRDSSIRPSTPELGAMISRGVRVSPTLRGIVDRIESSDVIVYIDFRLLTTSGIQARSVFVCSAGGRRYLRVDIDRRFSGADVVGLIGHELQHAAEIAGEPSVVDARSFAAFYRRVGFISVAGSTDHFETAAAVAAGRRVLLDALATPLRSVERDPDLFPALDGVLRAP